MVDTTSFSLSYWLEDPDVPRDRTDGESLGLPVLTSDGQLVTAQINLELAVVPDESELLLQAMRGRSSLSTYEVGSLLKDQLIAMAVGVQISAHEANDLRGNSSLLRGIYDETKTQLESRLNGYGLRLIGLSINWGLTQRESEQIAERRRESELADELHRRTIKGDRTDRPEQASMNVSTGVPTWIVLAVLLFAVFALVGSLIILSQSDSPAEKSIDSTSNSESKITASDPTSEPSITDSAPIILGLRGLVADFSESSSPVRRISFSASDGNLTSASIQVIEDVTTLTVPALAGTAGVHSYLGIEITSDESPHDIGAEIRFEISENWLEASEVFKEQVSLYRWDGEFWTELVTEASTVESGAVSFTSQTPGFSIFAIAIRTLLQAGLDGSANSTDVIAATATPDTSESQNVYVSSETGLSFVKPDEWILDEISGQALFLDSPDQSSYIRIEVTTDLSAFPNHQLWTAYQAMVEYSLIDQETYVGIDAQSFTRDDGGFEYQYVDTFSFEGDPTEYISGQNYVFLNGLAVTIYFISSTETFDANLVAFDTLLESLVYPTIQGSGFDEVPARECETLNDDYLYRAVIENTTFDVEVFATFTFLQFDCDIVGLLDFDSDELTGSGPLLGRLAGDEILFLVPEYSSDSSADLVFVGIVEDGEIFGDYTADGLDQVGIFYAVPADQLTDIPATPEPVPTSDVEPTQQSQPTPTLQATLAPTVVPSPSPTPIPTVVSTPTPQVLPTITPLASVTIAAPPTFPATSDGLVNLQNVFGLSSVPGDPLVASVDWGDGTGSKLANVLQFSGEILASHQYEQNGVFYITVEVRSDTGSRSSRVITIIVNISGASVTPTVTPVPVPTATAIPPIATATQTPISSSGSTFSLGSSKATVLAAQGNPSIIGGYTSNCGCYKWEYGNNWIGFSSSGSDGVVTNWEFGIPDGDLELVNYGPDGSSFTLGSTTATVLTAQGNPSTIGGYNSNCGCYRWHYGSGYVGFDASGPGGLVKNWADIPSGSLNITNYGPDGSTFTLGSTTAAVLAAQGSPPEISGYNSSCGCYKWWFVSDHISGWVGFDASGSNGVVKNWDNSRGNLNLQQ